MTLADDLAARWRAVLDAIEAIEPALVIGQLEPARPDDLRALEATLGYALPDELRAALEVRGGDPIVQLSASRCSAGPLHFLDWLPPLDIAAEWQAWDEHIAPLCEGEVTAVGPVRAEWWNRRWIPFTLIGGASFHHCVDLDPAPGGTIGQIIEMGREPERVVVAASLCELLAMLADDLRAGVWELDQDTLVLSDRLDDERTLGGFRSRWLDGH